MAIALALRYVVLLALGVHRALHTVEGPGVVRVVRLPKYLWDRIDDPGEDDADLSQAASDYLGYTAVVTTFSGDFEVRRVQMAWALADAGLPNEDVRVCTFHLLKVAAGAPVDTWDGDDFTDATNRFLTFWGSLRTFYTEQTQLQSIKFYREGPGIEPPQPPVHSNEPAASLGLSVSANMLPPQVALSVTERTSIRASWGRFYLPSMATVDSTANSITSNLGRVPTEVSGPVADAANVLYDGLVTDGLIPVVYRRPLPERENAAGETLDARNASALTVDTLQIDNLWDVIRSRRYSAPTLRTLRAVGS